MGVIRKKTGTRGTEGGLKYICDVCSVDITATVRIRCADPACTDYDLCVPCFSKGASSRDHNPATHSFSVVEQHSIPIFTDDWGADEELLLLEGAEVYGLGSWADIAEHIGGFRTKEEVRDHYISTYIDSPNFPLPLRAGIRDTSLLDEVPRELFQARKKRRIEERKEAAKNAPPLLPKPKPTASVPSCHEVQGYMPGRLEFETEYVNEAEEAVQHMQFEVGEGINPRSGELEPEMELKMVVMDVYNSKLTARATRKKSIIKHGLLEYKENNKVEKRRTKEERDLLMKVKPAARVANRQACSVFGEQIVYEHNLRQAIAQLQEWRQQQVGDLKSGEKYEAEKAQRAARPVATGSLDRLPGIRPSKPAAVAETPSTTISLTAPELPERLKSSLCPASAKEPTQAGKTKAKTPLANGTTNTQRTPAVLQPLLGIAPMKLTPENATDLHLLTQEEKELCSMIRVTPKAYLVMKECILREAIKAGGGLKRKYVKELCKIEGQKSSRLFEFFVHSGWVQKV